MAFTLSGSIITQSGTDTDLSGLSTLSGVTVTAYNDTTEYKLDTRTLIVTGTMTHTNDERLTFINGNTNAIVINGGGTYNFGTASSFTTNAGASVTVHAGMHIIDIGKPTGFPYVDAERGIVVKNNGTWNVLGGIIQTTKSIEIETGSTFLVRDGYFAFKSDTTFQNFYITTTDTDIVNVKIVDNMSPPTLNVGIQKNFTQFEGYNPAGTRRPLCIIDPLNIGTVLVEKYQGGGKNEVDVRFRTGSYDSQYWLYEAPIGNDLRVEGFGASKQSKGHARHYIRYNPKFKDSLSKALLQDVKVDLTDTDNGSRRTGQTPVQSPLDLNYVDTSNASGLLTTAPIDVLTGVWHNFGNFNRQVYVLDDRLPVVGNCIQYLYNISSLALTDSKIGNDSADVLLVEDATLTETNKTTVDAYTEIGDAYEAYDRAKSYLYDNYDGEGDLILGRSGTDLITNSSQVILDPSAVSVFDIGVGTVTIKSASTFTAGSDGDVLAKNGVLLSGGTFNNLEYQNAGATLTGVTVTGEMEMTVAGTYTFTNCNIALINNTSGGTITINSGNTTITSTTGSTVNIVAPPTIINFNGLESASQLVVYTAGTTTELYRSNVTSTSESYTHSGTSLTYDYTIQKVGFFPVRVTSSSSSNVSTTNIAVVQSLDRAYVASSSLTNSNVTFDNINKTIDITTATTVQNAYSYCIEAFISESSLRNIEFPLSTFGSASFSLDLDYEFTGTTINLLSRDGFRYTNAGNVKAIYCAVLSQGIVTGLQSEYVQTQGGTVVDSINTGNIDQVVKIYGDASNGNFDYRNHLTFKVQANGYRQAEVDVIATYGTLEATLYVIGLNTVAITGLTLGDPSITGITVTDNTSSPVSWDAGNGALNYSLTITDTNNNTGEDVLRHFNYLLSTDLTLNSLDVFQYPELVLQNGSNYETLNGIFRKASGNSTIGIRVIDGSGNPHLAFNRFQSDNGVYGIVPVLASLSVNNIVAGSRMQIFNTTTGLETVNQIVSGTSYTDTYIDGTGYSDGDFVRVRLTYQNGTSAKLGFTASAAAGASGWSVIADQKTDTVYEAIGVDGSTITIFEADYIDTEIDLIVSSNFGTSELYPFWVCNLATADGIRYFFDGIVAEDIANFRINTSTVDIMFDTDVSTNVYQNNDARIYRSDGVYPVKAPTTGGGAIDLVWRSKVLIAEVGTSGLTSAESNQLSKLDSIEKLTKLIPATL